jgi:hypothetical protein
LFKFKAKVLTGFIKSQAFGKKTVNKSKSDMDQAGHGPPHPGQGVQAAEQGGQGQDGDEVQRGRRAAHAAGAAGMMPALTLTPRFLGKKTGAGIQGPQKRRACIPTG